MKSVETDLSRRLIHTDDMIAGQDADGSDVTYSSQSLLCLFGFLGLKSASSAFIVLTSGSGQRAHLGDSPLILTFVVMLRDDLRRGPL